MPGDWLGVGGAVQKVVQPRPFQSHPMCCKVTLRNPHISTHTTMFTIPPRRLCMTENYAIAVKTFLSRRYLVHLVNYQRICFQIFVFLTNRVSTSPCKQPRGAALSFGRFSNSEGPFVHNNSTRQYIQPIQGTFFSKRSLGGH